MPAIANITETVKGSDLRPGDVVHNVFTDAVMITELHPREDGYTVASLAGERHANVLIRRGWDYVITKRTGYVGS